MAIWGATSPALQVEPYYPTSKNSVGNVVDLTKADWYYNAIVPKLPCQPCSNYGTKQCPQVHFACMKKQDLQAIADKAIAFYKEA